MPEKVADTLWYMDAPPDDQQLYFSQTFLKVKLKGDPNPPSYAFIEGFGGLGGGVVQLKRLGARASDMFQIDGLEFDFRFPNIGAYNFKNSVVLFARKTARQNKKALCSTSCWVLPVHERMRALGRIPELFQMKNAFSFTLANVNEVFGDPKFTPVTQAFAEVSSSEYFSRALSNEFYITPGVCSPQPDLWLNENLVGTMVSEKEIEVREPLLLQEVKDFFRKDRINIHVN